MEDGPVWRVDSRSVFRTDRSEGPVGCPWSSLGTDYLESWGGEGLVEEKGTGIESLCVVVDGSVFFVFGPSVRDLTLECPVPKKRMNKFRI